MNLPELSILIPAAGASERLGQAKQLVTHKGHTLIQNAVNTAHSINPDEIIIVTGANAKAVKNAVKYPGARWIHNSHWSTGMGSSIALGAEAISTKSAGLMILLCDQWRIQTHDLHQLVEKWHSDPQRIVTAKVQDHFTPPVIFPVGCFDLLRRLEGRQGARSILKAHPGLVSSVEMPNASFDLDTRDQLHQLDSKRV